MAVAISPSTKANSPISIILFDVDGVLWDTRLSYDSAILQTVDYLVSLAGNAHLQGQIKETDLHSMRRAGQLNSDWDLTYVLFTALLHDYRDLGRAACDTAGQGVNWAHAKRGEISWLEFDIIQKYFDLVYWGHEEFGRLLGENCPPLPFQKGTWQEEKPLVEDWIFKDLSDLGIEAFGIATGRSTIELQTVLQDGLVSKHIPASAMCTRDILKKPDPEVVSWCLGKLGYAANGGNTEQVNVLFCGDTKDDLQLALNYANWDSKKSIPYTWIGGVAVVPQSEFDFYLREGAVACIDHVRHLPCLVRQLNKGNVK